MKPNDANGARPAAERPFRMLIIAGSDRRQYDCPGADSKARTLLFRMADRLPQEWEIDLEDLGNVWNREQIRTCNGCVSTSMALCVWPCNCYEKGSRSQPDLMWNLDLYARLDLADAWAIIGPVNWYGPTSNLKAMFDRLVCMNGGNPREDLIDHKDPALAIQLEHAAEWQELSRNHLEGRTAAFFCYGDGGGDELDASGRPKILEHKSWFDPEGEPFEDGRDYYGPLVWQCRYSGIEVPDELWRYAEFGVGAKYSDNQAEHMVQQPEVLRTFDAWTDAFARRVAGKGKVTAGRYRAYGYRPPSHLLADLRTKWRGLRMALGIPVPDTSPAIQQELELNHDATLHYKRGEGKKLRD
jgi:NADPH-dependent FMN reductase